MNQSATNHAFTAQTAAINAIIALVASHFSLGTPELLGPSRAEPVVTIRQIAMKLARDLTGASYPDLAHAFGKDDHNTIRHACAVVDQKVRHDEVLRPALAELTIAARAALRDLNAAAAAAPGK